MKERQILRETLLEISQFQSAVVDKMIVILVQCLQLQPVGSFISTCEPDFLTAVECVKGQE